MADADLKSLLDPHKSTLNDMAKSLATGDHAKFAAYAGTLVAALATGNPQILLLAPFAEKAVARAFGNAADAMLRRELATLEKEETQRLFLGQLDEVIAALIGQALIQIVRVQNRATDEVMESLGGLREDLAGFREEFRANLSGAAVRIDEQMVRDGAIGVRVGPETKRHVFIARQEVTGEGSIGIDLR